MSDPVLSAAILDWLRFNAKGNANAKPRRELMKGLVAQGLISPLALTDDKVNESEDRRLRRAYQGLERVGSCSRGLFYIVGYEDRKLAQGQLRSKAMAELVREKRIACAEERQGELFGGGEA